MKDGWDVDAEVEPGIVLYEGVGNARVERVEDEVLWTWREHETATLLGGIGDSEFDLEGFTRGQKDLEDEEGLNDAKWSFLLVARKLHFSRSGLEGNDVALRRLVILLAHNAGGLPLIERVFSGGREHLERTASLVRILKHLIFKQLVAF